MSAPERDGARAYFVGCAALVGFALAYALTIYARLPHAYYDPIARRWLWAVTAGPIPMGYVGQIATGALGALAAGTVAGLALSTVARTPSPRAWGLWAAWTLTALLVVAGYFAWNNWP